jgi:hypothetical protein
VRSKEPAAYGPLCQVGAVRASQHKQDANSGGIACKIAWCVYLADRVKNRLCWNVVEEFGRRSSGPPIRPPERCSFPVKRNIFPNLIPQRSFHTGAPGDRQEGEGASPLR